MLIFFAALLSAFLGCVQAINVNRGHRLWAGITSVLIACTQFYIYRHVPNSNDPALFPLFVTGGVLGSQLSMIVKGKNAP
jgi:hypothetical protein